MPVEDRSFRLLPLLAPLIITLPPPPPLTRAVGVRSGALPLRPLVSMLAPASFSFPTAPRGVRAGVRAGVDAPGVRGWVLPFAVDGVRAPAFAFVFVVLNCVRARVRTGVRVVVRDGVLEARLLGVVPVSVLTVRRVVGVGVWFCTSASFAFSRANLLLGVAWSDEGHTRVSHRRCSTIE